MKLKLRLMRDGETLFEVPLSAEDWAKKELKEEMKETEESFERFSKIFDAVSHETRLRMMMRLLEAHDHTLSFADFMQELNLNPKIVWENSRKLENGGLLEKTGRGKYACSEVGETFMMMSLALRRLIESLEGMEEL
jgi:DNA-binding HxlR family transcriptional regulator